MYGSTVNESLPLTSVGLGDESGRLGASLWSCSCPLPVALLTCFRELIILRQTKQSAGYGPTAQMPPCWASEGRTAKQEREWRERGREAEQHSILHFGIVGMQK